MSNLQNRNPNNREVPPENNGIDPGRNVAYRDGYHYGRASERRLHGEQLEVRDTNNTARGLIIGIALTSLVGLAIAAFFLLNRRPEEPVTAPVVSPVPQATQPSEATQTPQPQTTIIQRERTIERVPQVIATPTSPAATTQPTPRINVTIPPQPTPRVNVTVPSQPTPRVNVTVPSQPTPQVSVNVPQQPAIVTPNTTINVIPSQPQSGDRTNNSSVNGTNTNTTGTTQRSATGGSGTIVVTPNNTNSGTTNTNPNVTSGTSSRTSTQ